MKASRESRLWLPLLAIAMSAACAASVSRDYPSLPEPVTQSVAVEKTPGEVGSTRVRSVIPPAGGVLTVVKVLPSSEMSLGEDTVISVVLDYRIRYMRRDFRYGIAPFFAERTGSDRTFCALGDVTAALRLTTPEGKGVSLHYPIRAEWRGGRLALPPKVWFCIIEQSPSSQRVLAEVGPFSFQ